MPCRHVKIGDSVAIVCTGKERTRKCRWCKAPGAKLCDFRLPNGKTCDAPCCYAHARCVGIDKDHCPDHADIPLQETLF